MSILSGFLKTKKYRKKDDGNYQLQSEWTSSETVEMGDGNTLETNLGSIKGITSSLSSTSSNYALSASAGKSLQDQTTTNTNSINTLNTNLNKKLFYPDFAGRLREYSGTNFEYTVDSAGAYLIAKITNTGNVNYDAYITVDDIAVGHTNQGEISWVCFPVAPNSTIKSRALSNVSYDIWVYRLM